MKLTIKQLKGLIKEAIMAEQESNGSKAYILYVRDNKVENRVGVFTTEQQAQEVEQALEEQGLKTFLYYVNLDPSTEEVLAKVRPYR